MTERKKTSALVFRTVALVWVVMSATGCTKQDSSRTSGQLSDVAALEQAVSSADSAIADTEIGNRASKASKYSDGCETSGLAPGVHSLSLSMMAGNGVTWWPFLTHRSLNPAAYPVLIVMHGYGGNGAGMREGIGLNSGLEKDFVALYPDGAGATNSERGWNSGHPRCCGAALRENVDDVAFLRTLVATVAEQTCIDLERVYATGFSNGGDMAQRLACDASDVVAAVTSVAGRFDYHAKACPGERPVPTVLYRGQQDRVVPYDQSLLGLMAIKTLPAIEGFEQIARNHNCRVKPVQELVVGDTDCMRFSDCDDAFEISLCTTTGAAHCWPGVGGCAGSRAGAGEFSASNHMREFFSRHRRSP